MCSNPASACASSDSGSDYCDLITNAEEDSSLADVDPTDPEGMEQLTSTFRDIADAAPDDIAGDWETVADGFEAFASEEPPTDESLAADMDTALQNIEQHVQDECDIDLQG